MWDKILQLPENTFTQSFLEKLPLPTWIFKVSLQRNEMFVFGLKKETIQDALQNNNFMLLQEHLFRVQKISESYYNFRLHTETKVDDIYEGKRNENLSFQLGKAIRIQSTKAWHQKNPIKVRVDNLGKIVKIG